MVTCLGKGRSCPAERDWRSLVIEKLVYGGDEAFFSSEDSVPYTAGCSSFIFPWYGDYSFPEREDGAKKFVHQKY